MSSTGMSLNERFTVLSKQQQLPSAGMASARRGRSRSRSRQIVSEPMTGQRASQANLRLLNEFKKKHAVQQTALKLKRRSLRTATTSGAIKRVGVKSLRLAPNGRPIRTNSLTRIATMRADLVANNQQSGRRTLRRTNQPTNNVVKRLGVRRSTVGGAAERIAKRRLQRGRSAQRIGGNGIGRGIGSSGIGRGIGRLQQQQQQPQARQYRGRSRSRSRGPPAAVNGARTRSQSRGRLGSQNRGFAPGQTRGRTPIRNRGRQLTREQSGARVSVMDRLGVRPGAARNVAVAGSNSRRGRRATSKVRGVTNGRIQKRRGANANPNVAQKAVGAAGRPGRARGRSAVRNAVVAGATRHSRSRSRTRKGAVGGGAVGGAGVGGRQQQPGSGNVTGRRGSGGNPRRGRSLQRRGNGNNAAGGRAVQNNNNNNNNNNGKKNIGNRNGNKQRNNQQQKQQQQQHPQERRGRSRSRGRGRNVGGKNIRPDIKKEDLDNELDQYMATTKTDMDYLLK